MEAEDPLIEVVNAMKSWDEGKESTPRNSHSCCTIIEKPLHKGRHIIHHHDLRANLRITINQPTKKANDTIIFTFFFKLNKKITRIGRRTGARIRYI